MQHRRTFYQAIVALLAIWLVVFAVRSYAGSKKITAERIQKEISGANFDDWSQGDPGTASLARKREEKIREIANLTNRLDFQEREKNRDNRGFGFIVRTTIAVRRAPARQFGPRSQ